jgi:TonB family protein
MTTSKRAFLLLAAGLSLSLASARTRADDEPPVPGEGKVLIYLNSLHAKVHRSWADSFLAMATARLPKDHPVNLSTRTVVVEVVLTPSGRLLRSEVTASSGAAEFDSSAVEVVRENAPFVAAPEEALSDDGNVYVEWTFARDRRSCSGLRVKSAQLPLPEAMRNLVGQGREGVAIARLQATADDARANGFSAFAWAWLERSNPDHAVAVAAARAVGGDQAVAERLREALKQGKDVETAAAALARLGVPTCPLVKEGLEGPAGEGRGVALTALRFGLDRECLPGALVVAKDRSAPQAQRVAAAEALGTLDDPEAQKTLLALSKDGPPAMRAMALIAGTRPGSGRGAVFRLTGLLHDPSPEVRAAASSALLRAGGEAMVPQLFQLYKEKDPRPGEAVAQQMGTMKGEASADMLGRMVRGKSDRRIRLASAWALVQRGDEAAGKLRAALANDEDPELRFLASAGLEADKRLAAAGAADGYRWFKSYRVLAVSSGRLLALDWVLAQFSKLDPATRVEVMGAWLAGAKPGK